MNINFDELKGRLASSIQNAVNKTHPGLLAVEKGRLVDGLQSSVNGCLDAEMERLSLGRGLDAGERPDKVVPDRGAIVTRMSARSGYVKFESGVKYHSKRIELHTSSYEVDGRWSLLLPVNAKSRGRPERDGKCSLHLKDGCVGQCRCTGYDDRYLRFEGVGRLEIQQV